MLRLRSIILVSRLTVRSSLATLDSSVCTLVHTWSCSSSASAASGAPVSSTCFGGSALGAAQVEVLRALVAFPLVVGRVEDGEAKTLGCGRGSGSVPDTWLSLFSAPAGVAGVAGVVGSAGAIESLESVLVFWSSPSPATSS